MRADRSRPIPHLLLLLLSILLAPVVLPVHAFAQSTPRAGEKTLATRNFMIIYPDGEDASAQWYAGFIDEVDDAVSEMLGSDPLTGLTLHIYATEADYIAANPAAGDHAGIMAHAIPEQMEVGVAVERLRQVEPEIATQSFRHEMTHIVAGALSDQNLPIGFQEGLAQYNELSTRRAQDSMQALKNANGAGTILPTWDELNQPATFAQDTALAYPEAYSVMAFLADRYGMGDFAAFLGLLKDGEQWQRALLTAFGQSERRLQSEWLAYLPDFISTTWQKNLLTYYDLTPGIALYDAGQFKEAAAHFTQSKALYSQLGRTDRVQAAGELLEKAESAATAEDQAASARTALESYDYQTAFTGAQNAIVVFNNLKLDAQSQAASDTLDLAQKGLDAMSSLDSAKAHMKGFNLVAARSDARSAAQAFADMGDTVHTDEANRLVSQLSGIANWIGFGVLAFGLLALAIGIVVGIRRWYDDLGRVRAKKVASITLANTGKENAEWM